MPTIPKPAACLSRHKLTKALKTFLKRMRTARRHLFTVAVRQPAFIAEGTRFSWLSGTSAAEKILRTIPYRSGAGDMGAAGCPAVAVNTR
jgi:hypothetical protein